MKNYLLFICLIGVIQLGVAQVSGTVYQDLPVNGTTLNTYGVKDANELGVEGVTVTAYPGGMSTTTAADGTYSLATGAGDFRIEFTWPTKPWFQSSPDASAQNTTVQFVAAPVAGVDFGLHNPTTYSLGNPKVLVPAQVNGDPNGGGIAASTGTLVLHSYTANTASSSTGIVVPTIANFGETGSVYGGAWQRSTTTGLLSAFAKRYVGFKNDPGSVFKVSDPAGTPVVSEYFSLDALGFSTGAIAPRGLPADFGPAYDVEMFGKVGTLGIGDIEFDANEENLYLVNLNDKKLYKVNIANPMKATITASDITSFNIPDPGCINGNWRPFALGLDEARNVMFIGGVCDAATGTRSDLHAYIYEFDLTTQTMGGASVFDFPLDFERGFTWAGMAFGAPVTNHWNVWSDEPSDWLNATLHPIIPITSHPEPLLADIEVEVDGSLILSFRDLWGDRMGVANYVPDTNDMGVYHTMANGDLYKAKLIGGVYELENNGQFSDGTMGCGVGNGDGPGGGEYYCEDFYSTHENTSLGGLAYLEGGSHFVNAVMDPNAADSGGTRWMSIVPGTSTQRHDLYKTVTGDGTFSKANGLGDVELLYASAPIEIGNLVWDDTNSNGIQDAGEAGIAGVVVELQDAGGTQITTATTDANGNYIFSNDPNGTSTASHIYNVALSANTAYKLVVPSTNGGNNLTTANTGEGSNTDINDSDANTTTGIADVLATDIPIIGANNHSFDFAYAPVPVGCSMVVTSATPTACNAATNTYDLAVVVTYSTPPAGNITVTTDNGGNMSVAQSSSPQTITLTGLTSDGVAGIDVTAVFDGDAACTDTSVDAYDAPASCAVGCPPTVCGTVTVVKN